MSAAVATVRTTLLSGKRKAGLGGAADTAGGLLQLWGASAMLDGEVYLRYPLFKVQDLKLRDKLVKPLRKPQQDTVTAEDDTDCRIRFPCYLSWYSVECLHRARDSAIILSPESTMVSHTAAGTDQSEWNRLRSFNWEASYFQMHLHHNNTTCIRVEHKVHMNPKKAEGLRGPPVLDMCILPWGHCGQGSV